VLQRCGFVVIHPAVASFLANTYVRHKRITYENIKIVSSAAGLKYNMHLLYFNILMCSLDCYLVSAYTTPVSES
jgi:hypothetical protein